MSLFLFDLDNTLLDTGRVVNEGFKPALQTYLDLDLETFTSLNQVYWQRLADSTDFDPQGYVAYLADHCQADASTLLKIVYQPEWYATSVFSDVRPTLEKLQATHQLGIFSQGNREYQTSKVQLAQLEDFFDPQHRYIFERKLVPEVLDQLPEATIIDDRLAVVETLSDSAHLTPVWLNRHGEKSQQKMRQIQSLSDLLQ